MSQQTHDDIFILSSYTAVGMAEYLLAILNTVIHNLPEPELRKMRESLDRSVTRADELLYNIAISSSFEMLTVDDGMCILPSAFCHFPIFSSRKASTFGGPVRTATSSRSPGKVAAKTPAVSSRFLFRLIIAHPRLENHCPAPVSCFRVE